MTPLQSSIERLKSGHAAPSDVMAICAAAEGAHASEQAASDNSDWFDALVKDLSEMLGCEPKPYVILEVVKFNRQKSMALDFWEKNWPRIGLGIQASDKSWSWLDRNTGRVHPGFNSLLEALQDASIELK